MEVVDCNLTAPGHGFYMHEGIYNPVLCRWKEDDGEHEDWFDPSTVKLVRRASA